MARLFIYLGVLFILIGIFWQFGQKLGLGHLPGDISIRKENYSFHFPIVTCLLLSALFSILVWLIQFFRR